MYNWDKEPDPHYSLSVMAPALPLSLLLHHLSPPQGCRHSSSHWMVEVTAALVQGAGEAQLFRRDVGEEGTTHKLD